MIKKIQEKLESRHIEGDDLLDALDIIEDIISKGGLVTEDGFAILYHATSIESANQIIKEGLMYGKENAIYFSTKKDGQISGYGPKVIEVRIPVENLILDDEFDDELHYKINAIPHKKVKIDCL